MGMPETVEKKNDIKRLMYADFLRPYLKKGARILDVGCSDDHTFGYLSAAGSPFTYYGIDMVEHNLKGADRDNNLFLIAADLEDGSLPVKSKFDIVILAEVLEHLKSPDRLMRQVSGILADNGTILISLPNEYNILSRLRVLSGLGIDDAALADKDKHLHFPTIAQSRKFVAGHFKIIRTGYFSSSGGRLSFLLKIIPDAFLTFLCRFAPDYLSRGVIFLCKKI